MHEIAALVVSQRDAKKVMSVWPSERPVRQAHGVCAFALRPRLLEDHVEGNVGVPDLEDPNVATALQQLFAPLLGTLRSTGLSDVFSLILTQYWGGVGTQAAVVVTHRGMISSLTIGADAINDALRQLGLESTGPEDAFQKLGLDTWRRDDL